MCVLLWWGVPCCRRQSLSRLESLLLEGNPVRREACYRLYVVGSLSPSLAMLDKAPVTSQERAVREHTHTPSH